MAVIKRSPNSKKLTRAILHLIFLYIFNVALENHSVQKCQWGRNSIGKF